MNDPENLIERIAQLEREVAAIKRVFQNATGADQFLAEDCEAIRGLIAESPGMSQTGVACTARARFGFSRQRTTEILRAGAGNLWRIESGMYNALLYFAIADGTHAQNKTSEHSDHAQTVNCA